jgi:hypothetical protein
MVIDMQPESATAIKRSLRDAALEFGIDLTLPENRVTFWTLNGSQGYLCWSKTSDFTQLELRTLLHQFWPDSPTILEITEQGDRVILLSAQVG